MSLIDQQQTESVPQMLDNRFASLDVAVEKIDYACGVEMSALVRSWIVAAFRGAWPSLLCTDPKIEPKTAGRGFPMLPKPV